MFDGWKEGVISFPPTYKYGINSDVYVGENPKEGEKKRSPAWYVNVSENLSDGKHYTNRNFFFS
mgnify:CR=1 FL=1